MRHILFAVLIALPTALITWMITIGTAPQPAPCPVIEATASEQGGGDTAPSSPEDTFTALLAEPLAGARPLAEPETFRAKGLFSYINGGAPKYIEHNFEQLLAVEMKTADGGELTCDIYDMSTPEDATAIYDLEGHPGVEPIKIGDAGRQSDMALAFRRDRYYVKLTAFDKTAEATLPAIAQALASKI